jgi:hypothetical protein
MRPRASRWQGVFAGAATKSEAEAAGYPPAMSSTTTRSPSELDRLRRRSLGTLWSTSALASLGSGVLLAAAGYAALGVLGAILVVIPAGVLTLRRSGLAATPSG